MNISTRYRLVLTIFAAATLIPIWSSSAQSRFSKGLEVDIEYPTSPQAPQLSCYNLADAAFNACITQGTPRLICEMNRRSYKRLICDCKVPQAQQPRFCGNDRAAACEIDYEQCMIGAQISFEACLENSTAFACRNIRHQDQLVCQGNRDACIAALSQLHLADTVLQDIDDVS